jgi:hypothetical protein
VVEDSDSEAATVKTCGGAEGGAGGGGEPPPCRAAD